jgi:hypothetical protein
MFYTLGSFYITLLRGDCPNGQKFHFFLYGFITHAAAPDKDARYSSTWLNGIINTCYCLSDDPNSLKRTSSNYPPKQVLKYLATQDYSKLCAKNTFSPRQINELPFCGQARERLTVATCQQWRNAPRQNATSTKKQHTSWPFNDVITSVQPCACW